MKTNNKMMHRYLFLMLILTLAFARAGSSQQPPRPLTGVAFSSVTTRDTTTGVFTYAYTITNSNNNNSDINIIQVEITRAADEITLPQHGLVNGPGYLRYGSDYTLERIPTVPVGISGPKGWTHSIGESAGGDRSFASWGPLEGFEVSPGRSSQDLTLTSYGLPGIRNVEIVPWIDPAQVPEDLTDWEQLNSFYRQFQLSTKTVGPTAPKIAFRPVDFLDYLMSLVHQSRGLGWIRNAGVHQSLVAKLSNAKRQLENGNKTPAKNLVGAFMNEVQGASCQTFSCSSDKPLNSEAYALLFFNGQYLYDRLE